MRSRDKVEAERLRRGLAGFQKDKHPLPGIGDQACLEAFVGQLIDSVRRINFIKVVGSRPMSALRADPLSDMFDPVRAAILQKAAGSIDEAFWLVFLSVHFGKNRKSGWRLARDVYGRLGQAGPWNWARVSADPAGFRGWLAANVGTLKGDGVHRAFGNHRKYQSLDAWSPTGTGAAVASYVGWVGAAHSHQAVIAKAQAAVASNPKAMFGWLYESMDAVRTFGRTARFDYLTMVGKLGLAPIEADSTYMQGATGPLIGARLLFCGNSSAAESAEQLNASLAELGTYLSVGMQVLEDSLCNWQKSPNEFKPFRG